MKAIKKILQNFKNTVRQALNISIVNISVTKPFIKSCTTCRFNNEGFGNCTVGTYYAKKGLNCICYEGELWEASISISNSMLELYKSYGWEVEESTSSDIKAKTNDGYTMTIEDGRCPDIIGALTFIYGQGGPVFEGRVETPEEVILLMKMLGFEKNI